MQVVCECVVIIKGIKEVNWKSAKGMLSDPNFLRNLQQMNCDNITQKQVQAVKAHMKVSACNVEINYSNTVLKKTTW